MSGKNRCIDESAGERLGAYEMGLLSSGEAARFEDHLESCSSCQEELYEMAPLVAEIRSDPGRYASLLGRQEREEETLPILGRLVAWFRTRIEAASWRSLVPAAATVAILIAVFVQQRGGPDWESLARVEALPYVQMPTRGTTSDAEARFRDGMGSYVQKEYGAAARRLGALLREGSLQEPGMLHDQTAFFAGLSFLLAGRPDSAAVHLGVAAESVQPVLRDRSRWYLAQTALLQAKPDLAREMLEQLAGVSPGYGQSAVEQLESMNRLQSD